MSPGKMAAQASHACSNSLLAYLKSDPSRLDAFTGSATSGSRVVLKSKNERELQRALEMALESGLPCYLMVDSGHVMPPHFDGSEVVTALGVGPCTKEEARHITKRFNCI